MKKWISIIVVTLLCALIAPASLAEENLVRLAANVDAVKTVLDKHELTYTQFGDNNDVFYLGYDLECVLNSCELWIIVYDDGVHFQADCEANAPEGTRDSIAAYMIRANEEMRATSLYMDYETGLIGCQYFLFTGSQIPMTDTLEACLVTVLSSLEEHGNNLATLMYSTTTSRL